ncbi:hypothetical protein [uncultured Lutibacter sp.]|uniref:hypothetical protein n=1 Tax=uncultured Lutibacter sp. TaxID=437739 RepID=UPI002624F0F8|nr:hypothetical protein [uncultured Lutibacter sp.]
MKNNILYLIVAVISFSSCNNTNDVPEQPKTIAGTWNAISFISNQPLYDMNSNGINSTELLEELPCRYSTLILRSDLSFYQENNTFSYDEQLEAYSCTTTEDISFVSGTWKVNQDFTLLSLEVNGNTAFLEIEFDGELLKFESSEKFVDRNQQGEFENMYGKVILKRN